MGIGILCFVPQILLEVFFPYALGITAFRDSVDYEFSDERLAWEFAFLNEDAEWVRVEGVPLATGE